MRKRFIWSENYSVKVPSLDEQHKRFFEITNRILDLTEEPYNLELKRSLLVELVALGDYALRHFGYEEDCMTKYNCSGCGGHPEAHNMYRDKIKVYLRRAREGEGDINSLAREVAQFTQDWLSGHILNKDREYIDCLTDNDVQ